MEEHKKYMQRCLELARNGLGYTAPNPIVGCVIVYNNKIIGEGYHRKYGEAHAELNAVNSVKNKFLLSKSTVYVNLEPCAHYGKTPPCVDLLIAHQVSEVVIGCIDTFSEVSGKGIEKLRNSGCKVIVGILENEAREINKRFFTFWEKKRPFIILKWAQTLDGFIDKNRTLQDREQNKISAELSGILVHKWRGEEQAIMVGTNTALNDNPKLNVRNWTGTNPMRIVLDKELSLPSSLHLFDQKIPTLVITKAKRKSLNNLEYILSDFKNIPESVCKILYERNIQSIIVEGGAALLNSFIDSGLWDEARIFIAPVSYKSGKEAPVLKNSVLISKDTVEIDSLFCFKNIISS